MEQSEDRPIDLERRALNLAGALLDMCIIHDKKQEKESLQAQIIIDNREKNSLVIANLLEKKAKIRIEQLEIADYLIDNIAIERKTYSDFISSILFGSALSANTRACSMFLIMSAICVLLSPFW